MRGYPIQGNSLGAKREANGFERYITYLRCWRKAGYTATILLGLTIFAILCPISFKAVDNLAEATAGTAQDSTITLSATKPTASVSLNVTSTSGSTATSKTGATQGEADERATFTVATNNAKGYKLSIKSSSGTTLTNGTDTLDAIGTSGITLDTFSTNTWGYLPSYYNNTANSTLYYPITTSDVTLRETNTATSTDGTSNPDTYTIALGLKADYTKSAGTYTNDNIVLTAIANPTPYTITYDKGNTTDTVDNIPSTESGSASTTSITLSSTVPTRTGYDFTGWCMGKVTTTNNVDSCTNDTTLGITAKTFQPGAVFGIDRTIANNTTTLHAMWSIKTFTCTKQYRLQNANDTNYGDYTADGSETVNYGGSCSYTKTLTDYKGDNGNNGTSRTTSASNITADTTLSLSFPRNTYTLTVSAGTNTSSATGSGTYRWGQTVAVGVTKVTNTTCISYATPTWSQSGTAGTFSSTSGASVNFTMGKGAATVTATSTASNISQTVTLSKTNATGIVIDGVSNTGTSASLTCGSHTISGSFASGYEFSSWATSNSTNLSVASTTTASTTITVKGAATLTLTGKSSKTYIQDLTLANCPSAGMTVYDKRDEKDYTVKLINGECWMTQNLRYLGDTNSAAKTMTIGNSNSNVTNKSITLYSLKNGDAQTFNAYDSSKCGTGSTAGYNNACVYDSGSTSTGVWYNYYAATAGTVSTNSNSTAASQDICPKNWHLPTGPSTTSNTDYNKLVGNTTSGWQNPTTGLTAFSAVAGGDYYNGSLGSTGYGYWWSATAYSTTLRYYLGYNSSDGQFSGYNYYYRYNGFFVRCVRSS